MLDDMFESLPEEIVEVHISHKCKGAFGSWQIPERCANSDFKFQHSIIFDKELYPGYKKVHPGNGSFPVHDAKTYIFRRNFTPEKY